MPATTAFIRSIETARQTARATEVPFADPILYLHRHGRPAGERGPAVRLPDARRLLLCGGRRPGRAGPGDEAAELACRAVADYAAILPAFSSRALEQMFFAAQQAILERQHALHCESQMKTTLNVVLVGPRAIHWAHVGIPAPITPGASGSCAAPLTTA